MSSRFLLENGDGLLLESGSNLLLELSTAVVFASGIGEQTVTIRLDEMATVFTDEEAD